MFDFLTEILSFSVQDDLLEMLEELEQRTEHSSRSKLLRSAVRHFSDYRRVSSDFEDQVCASLTVVHENGFTVDTNEFNELIGSHVHDHNLDGDCVRIFVVKGRFEKIEDLRDELESENKVKKCKLSLA